MVREPRETITLGRLLYEIARIWRARIDNSLQHYGLSRAKYNVILALEDERETGAGLTQRELANIAGVEPPSMATLLERMEKEGWVERRVCDDDRRSKRSRLTSKAIAIRTEIKALSYQVEQEVFANLPAETYDSLRAGLLSLREALEHSNAEPDK
ncbi:MAG: MarR family transcriptional regulator [Porticoccaceae bacterium]|nr:MarR family transcriptional regulator [Porticoccaceae bacterium]